MSNPYQAWVKSYVKHQAKGNTLPLGGFIPPRRRKIRVQAPRALIFSPHPDDECIIGGLAYRLLNELGFRVVNIAVTLGSRAERRDERWSELCAACQYLGFELEPAGSCGLEKVTLASRAVDPTSWKTKVAALREVLHRHRPSVVFVPHDDDWNQTHLGVHALVLDALAGFSCLVIETEFWGAMRTPNLMVEISDNDVADLMAALSFHAGEVRRNPYHLVLPAWMQDNARRGTELVGGQGGKSPGFQFATLYRLRHWHDQVFQPCYTGGKMAGQNDDLGWIKVMAKQG